MPSDHGWVEIKHLVAAGLLPAGTRLLPRPGPWQSALVRSDGMMEVDSKMFHTPSGAGNIVAFGVLLDTLVVRSLLVPALVHDLGSRVWWPSEPPREEIVSVVQWDHEDGGGG